MAEGIVGSVGVEVVPDARAFWTRFRAQTSGQATEEGRRSGDDWQRGFEAATRGTSVKVNADTTRARAEIAALNKEADRGGGLFRKLLSAAITLSPALLPLGAAAAGAGAELVTMGVVGALAFKGLQTEAKQFTPRGREVSGVVDQLKDGLSELEQTAAHGVLSGVERSAGKLLVDLPTLNRIIGEQSTLLGDTASHLTGGLVGGFETFEPVLDKVAASADRIAAHFEAWATGPGGVKFAQTISQDYDRVAPIIDDIAQGLEHVVVAAHPVGLGVLTELQILSNVVSAFPTPVLEAITAAFIANRTIGALSGVYGTIGNSLSFLGVRATASAAQTTAANLAIQASAAETAAEVAATQAAEAEAVAAAQVEIYASLAGTGSVLEETALAAATAASEEAVAFQAAATAAAESAAEISAAAEGAAAASAEAGAAASVSWSAMLGPAGIAVGAVALLGLTFLHSGQDTQRAARDVQGYTAALLESKGVINDTVRAKVAEHLANDGLFEDAQKYGISQSELTAATLGSAAALDDVNHKLDTYQGAAGKAAQIVLQHFGGGIRGAIDAQSDSLDKARQKARDEAAAMVGVGDATDYAANQLSEGNTALRAWVDAVETFNKSADTAADRATLIGQALVSANGDMLSYSGTMVSAATANQQFVTDVVQGASQIGKSGVSTHDYLDNIINLRKGTIDYHNAAAGPLISDLQALQTAAEGAASATYQHELRIKGAKTAADDAFQVYKNDTRGALIDEATQLGLTAGQAKKLGDKYFGLANAKDVKKKIELIGEDKVVAALQGILADLDILAGKTTVLDAQILQANRDAAKNPMFAGPHRLTAMGGEITGGIPNRDSVPILAMPGEIVIRKTQAQKHRSMLLAINAGAQGYADGGEVGGYTNVNYGDSSSTSGSGSGPVSGSGNGDVTYVVLHQKYSTLKAAEQAAAKAFRAQVHLGITIDTKDMNKFRAALKGTAQEAHDAFTAMLADARKLGLSDGLAATLRTENKHLDEVINDRNKAAAKLEKVTARFTQLRSQVKAAVTGSFDITTAGTGYDGQQPVTGSNILAQEKQAAARAKLFVNDLKALHGKISGAYWRQLATKGPDALPEVEALKSLGAGQLRQLRAAGQDLTQAGTTLGRYAGREFYGAQLHDLRRQERRDEKVIDRLGDKIERQLERAVDRLSDRPVLVMADGKVIARVVNKGNRELARAK